MAPINHNPTDAEIIEKLGNLKFVNRSKGRRSPHKPLMVLMALGHVARDKPRFLSYKKIRKQGIKLLQNFGSRSKTNNLIGYPFTHLVTNKIWEIEDMQKMGSDLMQIREHSVLERHNAKGGFTQPVYDKLLGNPKLILKTAQTLLNKEFPGSMHDDILEAVGLDQLNTEERQPSRTGRDPNFRRNVLRAYGSSCAICDFYARLDDAVLAVEAAHIQWHAYKGPSVISNGLALCTLHHKAFDRGALAIDNDMKVLVSEQLGGDRKTKEQHFYQYESQEIHLPRKSEHHPQPEYLAWHRRQVFKG
ncbi:MAG: HNH endonuclease [Gammaproteobacteria bacterium AqS3]|nr:HNH endonuclease [Gammaproteobacteria bacterium AqS3]